jgi:hypothetical protein
MRAPYKRLCWGIAVLGFLCASVWFLKPPVYYDPTPKFIKTLNSMQCLRTAYESYGREYGDYPPGSLTEAVKVLDRANSHKAQFFNPVLLLLNKQGQPIDAWGMPLHIKLFPENVQVISAGKDRQLGTADDIAYPDYAASSQ